MNLIFFLLITVHNTDMSNYIGSKFTLTKETSLKEITSHPEDFYNQTVKVRGIIASVCNENGCWIDLVDPVLKTQGVLVNFRGLKHTFPLDCVGREAVVEGRFYQKIYGKERVSHWQHHGFRKGEKIPEFSLIFKLEASAVKIGKEIVLKSLSGGPILKAQTDKIDLQVLEFESNKFGIGKKCLSPGKNEPSHSTGKYKEIILALQGSITVEQEGGKTVILSSGEISYISPETVHSIKNSGNKNACYIFVYAPQ